MPDIGGMAETKREYWRRLINEQETAGVSVRQFCRKLGVGEHSFYLWRKRLRESEPVRFALVETAGVQTEAGPPELELVLVTGERLRIGAGVDAAALRTVLEILRT